jgi:hypothetical protein
MSKNKIILRGKQDFLEPLIPLVIEINNLLEESRLLAVSGASDPGRVRRSGKPKIMLLFAAVPDGKTPYVSHDSEISFRLMNESPVSISPEKLMVIARRINTAFASPARFNWQKGRNLLSYSDWDKGYQLQILCKDRAEGRRVIEQVLDIQGHSPEWKYSNYIVNESPLERYPGIPDRETILGVAGRKELERPEVKVAFKSAIAVIDKRHRVVLVDTSGRLGKALIS